MKHYRLYLAALAILLSAVAAVVIVSKPDVVPQADFGTKMRERVVLPRPEFGETQRVEKYAEDGFTLESASVVFTDDSTGYITYRPSGTVFTFGKSYPESANAVKAKMEGEYAEDGQSLVWEYHYRVDGTVSRKGERLPDGNYLVHEFFVDGVTLASTQLFDKNGLLKSLERWYAVGRLAETLKEEEGGALVNERFNEAGKRVYYHRNHYGAEIWEHYQDDGETLTMRFEMKSESDEESTWFWVEALYYNEDGTLNHERRFGQYQMEVIFYNPDNGEVAYRQAWNHPSRSGVTIPAEDYKMTQDQYTLSAIFVGPEPSYDTTRFFFAPDGKSVERYIKPVTLPEDPTKSPDITSDYDRNTGQLKSRSTPRFVDGKVEWDRENYKAGETDEKFDYSLIKPEWLEIYPYELPPKPPLDPDA